MPEPIENRMLVDSEWEHIKMVPVPQKELICCDCQNPIIEGEDYWDFDGDKVCQDCIRDYVKSFMRRA